MLKLQFLMKMVFFCILILLWHSLTHYCKVPNNSNTGTGSFQFESGFHFTTHKHNSNCYENSENDYTQRITLFEMLLLLLLLLLLCYVYNAPEKRWATVVRIIRHFTVNVHFLHPSVYVLRVDRDRILKYFWLLE
jgi:hypothetical protein